MPFLKLDCGILDSSLWPRRPDRDVFITACLMATPRELVEPTPALEVDSLSPTGWSVPPGWYGFIEASGSGILSRAMVDFDEGMAALKRLGAPDSDSRTPTFDGRRLVRVAGGYVVLNYQAYRERDYSAADRQRRYRERKQGRREKPTPRETIIDGEGLPLAPPVTVSRRDSTGFQQVGELTSALRRDVTGVTVTRDDEPDVTALRHDSETVGDAEVTQSHRDVTSHHASRSRSTEQEIRTPAAPASPDMTRVNPEDITTSPPPVLDPKSTEPNGSNYAVIVKLASDLLSAPGKTYTSEFELRLDAKLMCHRKGIVFTERTSSGQEAGVSACAAAWRLHQNRTVTA